MTRWARVSTSDGKRPCQQHHRTTGRRGVWRREQTETFQIVSNVHAAGCPLETMHLKQNAKRTKRKNEYLNEDVNGFMEYLKPSSQALHNGRLIAADSRDLREEIAVGRKAAQETGGKEECDGVLPLSTAWPWSRWPPGCTESQDVGSGVCYRCGSTEHEKTKCRANADPALSERPFAKCFVCGEMRHLSKSCPDNTKGVCADGGGCKLCGSVEHFKKDCPENQNSDWIVTVGRRAEGMSADYEDMLDVPKPQKPKTKMPKVVHF